MKPQKPVTIIFDFDHTLFDTKGINLLMYSLYSESEIPEKIFKSVIENQRKKSNFDFLDHVSELRKLGYKIDSQKIDELLSLDLSYCLKGKVKETLDVLMKRKFNLILLTKGVDYFQRWKIRQAGLSKFFNSHIYTCEEKKEDMLNKLPIKGRTYFVNDHADEIEVVAKRYPGMNFIYVKGPKTAHDRFIKHKHIPTIDDISILPKIIK